MVSGLDDVIAAETVLSDVDGQLGRLTIRGHSLDDLAERWSYEEVLALLWEGLFGAEKSPGAAEIRSRLGKARVEVFRYLRPDESPIRQQPAIEAVRSLLSRIPDGEDLDTALRLVAAPAVFTSAVLRLQRQQQPIPPDPTIRHAADILRTLHGKAPTPEQQSALDRYLVTVSDHGLNASTFTARIVASTRAGLASAVIAALCALKGPLHGGAPGPVLDALDRIGSAERAATWLEESMAHGERLMGFGHRIYRVRDPRADALAGALAILAHAGQIDAERLKLAQSVEAAALDILARKKPNRPLQTNVEFYTALLLEALGFPREALTCVFAMGRTGGWIAHAREQITDGRLIRPQSRYIGPGSDKAARIVAG